MKQKSPNQLSNEESFDEEYWRQDTIHELNNLKLQNKHKKKTSNNKHEQPTQKLEKSKMTKTQK